MFYVFFRGFCDVGFCFFKQKTAYEMRISDWSSDVCSSDLIRLSYSLALALFVRRLFLIVRLGILRELSYNDPILSLQINAPQCQLCQAGALRQGEPKIEQERAEK